MAYMLENAQFQWRDGERRLRAAEEPGRASLERAAELVVEELRRRLGGSFELGELAELYGEGVDWAHDIAFRAAAGGEPAAVVDAAFGRYSREAADYSGGRSAERPPWLD
jgi:hypothetical protein